MRPLFFILTFLFSLQVAGQDIAYAREVLGKLCSPSFKGRGYVGRGDLKAAKFIRNEFRKNGVQAFNDEYFQQFSIPVNTFPHKLYVSINEKELIPGREFLVSSASPSLRGTFEVVRLLNDSTFDRKKDRRFEGVDLSDKFILTDKYHKDLKKQNIFNALGVIIMKDDDENLWWHVSNGGEVLDFMALDIYRSALPTDFNEIKLKIKNEFVESCRTRNVVGFIPGKKHPGSYIVFTAHYDHLGMMGKKSMFPGANDNGSGTAMIMDLARHYATAGNEPDHSMVFIAFAAEESGLHGSTYFAENPVFPLENITFLINLDMVGTGSDGITIVNGKELEVAFNLFKEINDEKGYLKEVKARGESCNSDHCPFYKKGVPAVFIYTRGDGYDEYHTINDKASGLPLTGYENLFKLLTDFAERISLPQNPLTN